MQTFDRRWGFGSYPGSWSRPKAPVGARRLTASAFVCAAIGVVVLPLLLGPAGIALGVAGARRGDDLGRWAAVSGAAALCVGTVLGALLLSHHGA